MAGPQGISSADLLGWQQLNRITLDAETRRAIRVLDNAWLTEMLERRKKDAGEE